MSGEHMLGVLVGLKVWREERQGPGGLQFKRLHLSPFLPPDCPSCRARQVLADVFPERRVVSVQSREILLGGGNIHCVTQQEPAAATG
jgi:hypothetical protein